jgi:Spx/MgsR family transcriptional regulator
MMDKMLSMFGIPNCDTVKKGRSFLEKNKITYEFIDFKKTTPTKTQIETWAYYAHELPINKKGTTYRKHKEHYESLSTPEKINFIIANPSIIKRPILVKNDKPIAIGFNEEQYILILANF